LLSCDWTAT